jgi:hypothetical protein
VIRLALLGFALVLLIGVAIPNPGNAREPEAQPSDEMSQEEESEPPEGRDDWRKLLLTANQELAIAEKRDAAALRAYKSMRRRRRPRGDGKQAIMDEIELAAEELARAQQNLADLEKTARREGALPMGLKFDPAEIDAATQLPAAQRP